MKPAQFIYECRTKKINGKTLAILRSSHFRKGSLPLDKYLPRTLYNFSWLKILYPGLKMLLSDQFIQSKLLESHVNVILAGLIEKGQLYKIL